MQKEAKTNGGGFFLNPRTACGGHSWNQNTRPLCSPPCSTAPSCSLQRKPRHYHTTQQAHAWALSTSQHTPYLQATRGQVPLFNPTTCAGEMQKQHWLTPWGGSLLSSQGGNCLVSRRPWSLLQGLLGSRTWKDSSASYHCLQTAEPELAGLPSSGMPLKHPSPLWPVDKSTRLHQASPVLPAPSPSLLRAIPTSNERFLCINLELAIGS